MEDQLCDALKQFQKDWPACFAGTELDKLTGHGYCWRTLQNQKSSGEAPEDVFLRSGGRKLLIVRDAFLRYWQRKLTR
jgi:hypothetical protein